MVFPTKELLKTMNIITKALEAAVSIASIVRTAVSRVAAHDERFEILYGINHLFNFDPSFFISNEVDTH